MCTQYIWKGELCGLGTEWGEGVQNGDRTLQLDHLPDDNI